MRAISLLSGIFATFLLSFFYWDSMDYDLRLWTHLVTILFLLQLHSMRKSIHMIYGYGNKMDKWIIGAMFLCVVSPYTLIITYPLLFIKSKYYSIENVYAQSIVFFLPFIDPHSLLHIQGAAKAFVLVNGAFMLSAGFEKLKSPLWLSGKAVEGFFSLPHLIKPWAYPNILVLSKLGNFIVVLEFFFLFALFTQTGTEIFILGLIGFGISLFTVFDISYIGQLLVASMIGSWIIWSNHSFGFADFSISNLLVFLIVTVSMINIFYPTRILSGIMKITTGAIGPFTVFIERHQTGLCTYKFKKDGKDILMAFNEKGLFDKSQIFTSRYKQAAMYKVTAYCRGLDVDDSIADLAYQAGEGETVVLCVKPYDSDKGYHYYKNSKWHEIAEISFNDTYNIRKLSNPPEIKEFIE